MRSWAAAAAVVVLCLAGCSGSSSRVTPPAPEPAGTPLTDGFVVAPGSRLLGPVFTYPDPEVRGVASRAVLTIDRDPVKVYDEYVTRARRLGILIRGSGTADSDGLDTCTLTLPEGAAASPRPPGSAAATPSPRDPSASAPSTSSPSVVASPLTFPGSEAATRLDCVGGGARRGTDDPVTAAIAVTWGGSSRHAVLSVGPHVPIRLNDLGDARATSPEVLPDVSSAPVITEAGAQFGPENNAFDRGYQRFTLESGSTVVAEVDDHTLLHVDGDTNAVMKGYAAQLGADGRRPEVLEVSTSRGTVLTVENSPDGGGAAFLLTDPSGRWLLIETHSD